MLSGSGSSQPRSSRGSSRGHVHGPSETLFKMKLTHRTEPKSAISTLILNEAIFANGKLKEVEYWTIRLVGPATVQGPDLENHREPSEHSKKRCFATGLLQRKLPQTSIFKQRGHQCINDDGRFLPGQIHVASPVGMLQHAIFERHASKQPEQCQIGVRPRNTHLSLSLALPVAIRAPQCASLVYYILPRCSPWHWQA